MKNMTLSRREFLHRISVGLAIPGVAGHAAAAPNKPNPSLEGETPAPTQPFPAWAQTSGVSKANALQSLHIWDGHTHLEHFEGSTPEEKIADMVRFADRMGIERLCVFADHGPTPEEMRKENDLIMRGLRASHDRVFGYTYMNPYYVQACLDELNRCVRDGPMIGLKFQYDTPRHANSPELDPIIERAGELHAVVMHHTWIQLPGNEEDVAESNPMELAELARRHPSVTIICGHTGGNWELGIRGIRDVKNLYADLCGSDPTSGYTEMAVRELGPERVMYGSDGAGRGFASQLGKVMGADITDTTRRLVLGGNLRRVLQPILKAKGVPL